MRVHSMADAMAHLAGMPQAETDALMEKIGSQNPMILIGGYAVDAAIVGVWYALKVEDPPINTDDIVERINCVLQVMYAGLI